MRAAGEHSLYVLRVDGARKVGYAKFATVALLLVQRVAVNGARRMVDVRRGRHAERGQGRLGRLARRRLVVRAGHFAQRVAQLLVRDVNELL